MGNGDMKLEHRMVPDPMMSDSEFYYRRRLKPESPNAGKVQVVGNAITRIGGLVHVRRRTQLHERAAEMFKSHYESLYGSGMPAIDAGRIQVDDSRRAHDNNIAAKLDRHHRLQDSIKTIGKPAFNRVVAVVVLGVSCSDLSGGDWRDRKQETQALLDTLDQLAELWGMRTQGG